MKKSVLYIICMGITLIPYLSYADMEPVAETLTGTDLASQVSKYKEEVTKTKNAIANMKATMRDSLGNLVSGKFIKGNEGSVKSSVPSGVEQLVKSADSDLSNIDSEKFYKAYARDVSGDHTTARAFDARTAEEGRKNTAAMFAASNLSLQKYILKSDDDLLTVNSTDAENIPAINKKAVDILSDTMCTHNDILNLYTKTITTRLTAQISLGKKVDLTSDE